MDARQHRNYWDSRGLTLLMGGLLLPPFAWLLDLQVSYAVVKSACEHEARGVLFLIPAGSLAIVVAAAAMSWSCWRQLRGRTHEAGGRVVDRSHLLAVSGLALSALFGLLILTSTVPRYVLSPCE